MEAEAGEGCQEDSAVLLIIGAVTISHSAGE